MVNPQTATILDTRKIKKDGTYPVKLRVTFERKQKYYPTPFNFTKAEFERVMFSKKLTDAEKILKKKVTAFENKAIDIVNTLPFFTWNTFEKNYLANRSMKDKISNAFTNYANYLRNDGRIGSAVAYECAMKSLGTFFHEAKFVDITPEQLRKYESWMLRDGKSITTVGIYLRSLRTLFNNAIEDGSLLKDYYPFGKRRYEIPVANNIKKALPLKDIGKIFNVKLDPGSVDDKAKDYWIFMYLCNGINVKDMCLLTYGNIKGDVLDFIRAKTVRTKRRVEPIRIALTDEIDAIIKKWGNPNKSNDTFIFPILKPGLTPLRERQLIKQMTTVINDHVRGISKKLGITQDVTTYAARHSFSTVLQRSGASTEFISEALGHSSVRTTANYLAGFEDRQKKEHAKALTAFPEE